MLISDCSCRVEYHIDQLSGIGATKILITFGIHWIFSSKTVGTLQSIQCKKFWWKQKK